MPWSPPPLYSTARQGPTSLTWAGRPRSGRESRSNGPLGPLGKEINLTGSPYPRGGWRDARYYRACTRYLLLRVLSSSLTVFVPYPFQSTHNGALMRDKLYTKMMNLNVMVSFLRLVCSFFDRKCSILCSCLELF